MTPPTYLRTDIFERASEPPQRSIARLNAWRTRTSSKGLRLVLKTIIRLLTQLLSNPAKLSFILSSSCVLSAAELGIELAAKDAGDNPVRLHEERFVAVEIGFALLEVARKAPAFPTGAAHMGQEG